MRISSIGAANLGFGAKHWTSGSRLGDGQGPEVMERAADTVVKFVSEDVPRELKLAASTIWLAVEHAHIADLYGATHDRNGSMRPYVKSEDGWRLRFIEDSSAGFREPPKNVGLEFTRSGFDISPSHIVRWSSRRGAQHDPRSWYSDAYVWIKPEMRGHGVATLALEQFTSHTVGDLRMPFDVDPTNVAATKLVERFVPQVEVATA